MIPRIQSVEPQSSYILKVAFDDGYTVEYDVSEDIRDISSFKVLELIPGLFNQVQLDDSRTCIYWNDEVDLPSDTIYEYGKEIITEGVSQPIC